MLTPLFATPENELAAGVAIAPRWLVDELLREQQQISAVDRFANWHEATPHAESSADAVTALRTRQYSELIPVGRPGEGEQFAFEVDLDACSGCKACVTACHNLNDLEPGETWRSVGLLHGGSTHAPSLQHVTTACHHCVDPACLKGCPVDAYAKDLATGIVRHLDDQCIGCQYCTFMCPYDVPKYSRRLGIVRKCDMCRTRLDVGEAPACVQSCPNSAIRIGIVSRQQAIDNAEANAFLPGAPEPGCTLPTTVYKTSRPRPANLLPADYFAAAPQHAHRPLILMLVLTQMSVGVFVAANWPWEADAASTISTTSTAVHATAALVIGLFGIGASTLHLGRPLLAFRAVIGWRRSWLSREIIAFGAFALLAICYTASVWAECAIATGPTIDSATTTNADRIAAVLGVGVCLVGLTGVYCSSMIYAATQRPFWSLPRTAAKFFLTCAVLGLPAVLLLDLVTTREPPEASFAASSDAHTLNVLGAIIIASGAKLLLDASIFASARSRLRTPLKRTAQLMTGELSRWTRHRFAWGTAGGIALPGLVHLNYAGAESALHDSPIAITCVAAGLVAAVIGELCERYLFFAAVVAPKMPGTPSA